MVFRIEMLPAGKGDCIWVEYGPKNKTKSVLIDGGMPSTSDALRKRIAKEKKGHKFELIVVTHVDEDHIGGVLEAVADNKDEMFRAEDFWFNSFDHLLAASAAMGPGQGDELTEKLAAAVTAGTLRWNAAFDAKAIFVPDEAPLPTVTLGGGAKLTILSPTPAKAARMHKRWVDVTEDGKKRLGRDGIAKLDEANSALGPAAPPKLTARTNLATLAARQNSGVSDSSPANGSSIAFLFEYGGKTVLFGADAHHGVLCDSLDRLSPDDAVSLDAFKLPHHGSNNNVSTNLINAVSCPLYLFSTNGDDHGHPNGDAVATTIVNGFRDDQFEKVELAFNYRNKFTSPWDNAELKKKYKYATTYPKKVGESLVIEL
ncbi:MAG: MBL fold metallo-hydrolase [Myxococcales bacterium]|nr:MBL fold metallo-hydrolase [Myxococcales bacterium]